MKNPKITIPATDLARALKGAAGIVESRNIMPILAMVKLVAKGDKLEITTSNMNIEYRETLACDVDGEVSCCVDARKLLQMASASEGVINMSLTDKVLKVTTGRSRWSARILPVDDFPVIAKGDLGEPMEMDGEKLAYIIERVGWAAAHDDARYYLQGVFINARSNGLSFAATNGNCLSVITEDKPYPEGAPDIIAPSPLLDAIRGAAKGAVSLAWNDRNVEFTCGDITITGKTIDGAYPDYQRVIPDGATGGIAIDVSASDLIGAVRRVSIASGTDKVTKVVIKPEDNKLIVQAAGNDGLSGEEEVAASCYAGDLVTLNADYLVAMLGAASGPDNGGIVTITQSGTGSPLKFTTAAKDDGEFIGVVMPMRA